MTARDRIAGALAACALALGLEAHSARANAVIEEYEGARPPEAERVMPVLREQLTALGDELGPDDVHELLHYKRVPAIANPNVTSAMIVEDMELGRKRWMRGSADAAKLLTASETYARDNGPSTVQIVDLDERRASELVALALSLKSAGDERGAKATMMELIRTYPDLVIARGKYSSDAEALYTAMHKLVDADERGTIVVRAPDSDVYVNEVPRGRGDRLGLVVLPGTYRVLVHRGASWWRYDVDVAPGARVGLVLDARLEDALVWTDAWFGLRLSSGDRTHELELLAAASRVLGLQRRTGVVGLERVGARLYLTAKVYDANAGAIVRSARTELGADDDARIAAIAAFVHAGTRSPYLTGGSH